MEWSFLIAVGLLFVLLPYSYVLTHICATAWFEAKTKYQRALVNELAKGE